MQKEDHTNGDTPSYQHGLVEQTLQRVEKDPESFRVVRCDSTVFQSFKQVTQIRRHK